MPVENNMMFVRPKNCQYCVHGYNALYHVVQHAQGFNIRDIKAEDVKKTVVYSTIDDHDPLSFYGFGHGQDCYFTGDTGETIFSCSECDKLAGRIVYLLSCLTANGLGPKIIENGAIAYAGFNISWTWLGDIDNNGEFIYPDPYNDPYALGFYQSANQLWVSLLDGKTFQEAVQDSINMYDTWIDYWFNDNPQDPYSQECIKWLAHDRDGLVALDQCMAQTTQENCENMGCLWYENACYSELPEKKGGLLFVAIPIIALVGLAFLVGER